MKKIAAIAEAAFVGIFPHLMGSPVNVAAFVHLDAAIPNYVLMESHTFADAYNEIVDQPVVRQGGHILVSDRPGIGIEIREDKLAKFPYQPKRIEGDPLGEGAGLMGIRR